MPADDIENPFKKDEDYLERVKFIFAALEACKKTNTPVGLRLERIMALYNQFYGKKHFTEIPITDEVEVLALIVDRLKIDRELLKIHAPTMVFYYNILKRSELEIDTQALYDYLEPEIEKHIKRYLPE